MYFKNIIHQVLDIYLIFFKISCDFENFLRTKFVGLPGKYQPEIIIGLAIFNVTGEK